MAEHIEYKRELFDFVNDLTAINPSIAFERIFDESYNADRICVRKSDKNRSLVYTLSVPVEYFDIKETVAFYMYSNFYKFLTSIKNVKLSVDGNLMVLNGSGVKLNYILSDEEGITNGPKSIGFKDPAVRFTLTAEAIDEIVKLNSLVKGSKAKISCIGTAITVTIYTTDSDNSFEKTFECERLTDYEDDIEFVIFSNRFEYLPSKRDYVVDITANNYIRISLINETFDFNMYTGVAK
jgi:hypothetical protein